MDDGGDSAESSVNAFENFIPHAVDAKLREKEWENELAKFYVTNSPRFSNFESLFLGDGTSAERGNDIDVQMHVVHMEYISIIEGMISIILKSMGVTDTRFLRSLHHNLSTNNETANNLYEKLFTYVDFVSFGTMMEKKYYECYNPPSSTSRSVSSLQQSIVPLPSSSAGATKTSRILWDLENLPVPNSLNGMETVVKLHSFLKSQNLMGPGIDTRITAFLNPFNRSISKTVIEELNKASVELVFSSAKREDSDRKLGMRINQEMLLLPPASSSFVLLSSDQDFRQHVQLLSNAGYRVAVVHTARHEKWKQALEMHATEAYAWHEVLGMQMPVTTTSTESKPQELGQKESDNYCKASNEASKRNVSSNKNASKNVEKSPREKRGKLSSASPIATDDNSASHLCAPLYEAKANAEDAGASAGVCRGGGDSELEVEFELDATTAAAAAPATATAALLEGLAVGWRVAVCLRWASAYGFLLVDTAHAAVSEHFLLPSEQSVNDPGVRIERRKQKTHHQQHQHQHHQQQQQQQHQQQQQQHVRVGSDTQASGEPTGGDASKQTSVPTTVRVFVHHSALVDCAQEHRMLKAGEYVLAFVEIGDKGPKATIVKNVFQRAIEDST
jgi:cold shock CspA family protein